jgi:tetratricopeptide (TPR) repeat protein
MRPALAVAAAAVLAYLPSFWGVFQFDDYNVLFRESWTEVRPLLRASYSIGAGFHLLNIAFHAMNAALLFLVGRELFGDRRAAFVAALLFALHPAATEAVTYISGRSVSMMALFYLGSMLTYLHGRYWVSTLLFLLALATKETAVTLPAALLLCELCRTQRPTWSEIARRQWPHWALLVAAGVFMLFNQRYFDLVTYGYGARGVTDNLLAQVGGVSYLVLRLVSLHGYNIDPALPALTEWTPALRFQAAALSVLLILGIRNLRQRPWIAFGILWFFLQLAPTNSIVPRLDVANDRQLYLACWGLFLALSVELKNHLKFTIPILIAFAVTSIVRQLDYRSEIALWESSVALAPWNARGHNNLGYAYQMAGRTEEARREYQAALLFDPGHAKARANLLFLPAENVKKR